MKLPLHEYVLAIAGAAALAALLVRLLVSGLARIYRFFFCYVLVDLAQTAAPFFIPFASDVYGYVFLITEGLMICFYVLIVFELYGVVLRHLKGIARLAQRYTAVAIGIAVIAALAFRAVLPDPHGLLEVAFYFESAVVLTLAVFILLITAFVAYYPIPLARNVVIYSVGYAMYFLSKAALLFLNNAGNSTWMRACSTALLAVSTAIVLFWALFLKRDGERVTTVVGHRWGTMDAQADILKRLNDLNESLVRARGK
jgi:hypothetical protein